MRKTLRKGETYIDIQYSSGGFSNNLYCSTSIELSDNRKTLELNFTKIANARIKTNSNDDLDYLIENVKNITQINFSDKQITERLIKNGVKQNENLNIEFISKEKTLGEMKIIIENIETFRLEK
ncbi:hypothetical protein KO506_10440 [Polaribacter vadi]|uniref:hypothetical protein n=1 Tax=Polaribacter TaxID=52959 RepID=UPI001C099330|nr:MULTISPECIES: hypothetical protein [Polaribacter]MBU3011823.1 hypothetical protein [Polaribacter vadi]MDO6741636.1 hypothetical protein [Polaribacter sp. 1_MG-2023]